MTTPMSIQAFCIISDFYHFQFYAIFVKIQQFFSFQGDVVGVNEEIVSALEIIFYGFREFS